MKKFVLLLLGAMMLVSCSHDTCKEAETGKNDSATVKEANSDHLMMAVLFAQKAAENRALFYQAFNTAKLMLEKDLQKKSKEKGAIVLDIDETVLDNSPYEALCVLDNISYPERWDEWCNRSEALACPGALDFLKYAAEKGYDIFYVTNRKLSQKEGTIKNLAAAGFPSADEQHVLFKTEQSSKEPRRRQIEETHRIALLIGDNLSDFFEVEGSHDAAERRTQLTDSLKNEFGQRFIILPNAMYGDWEVALYPDLKAPNHVKDSVRRANLRGF